MHRSIGKFVNSEDVFNFCNGLQAHMNVEAEDELITDGNNVPGGTIVCCRNPLRRNQFGGNGAKNFPTFGVE